MPKLTAPKNPPPITSLLDDEAFLGTWQPNFWAFAQRTLAISVISALILGPVLGTNPLFWLPIMALSILADIAFFDTHQNWLRHRPDVWHLTSFRLIYENQDEPGQNATLNLQDIDKVKTAFWKSVRVQLRNGQSVMIKYLANPKAVAAAISQAGAHHEGQSDV